MPVADFTATIPPSDRRLMRRLSIVLALIFVAAFAFSRLDLLYSHKFFDATGRAEWIWYNHRIASGEPLAFFITRDFDLPPNRYYAKIKIAADPQYTLYFNGREIGGHRAGDQPVLDIYDVTPLARTKGNRIVVALRSANGVGGMLASIDIAAEFQNIIATDATWNVVKLWTPDLLLRDPPSRFVARPLLLGRPPARRWNYLASDVAQIESPIKRIVAPSSAVTFDTAIPQIDIVEGVAVTVSKKTRATAFDFGPMTGRARLGLAAAGTASRTVSVRYANTRNELMSVEGSIEPFVFAPGERMMADPAPHRFRYIMVYGGGVRADAID